MANAPDAATLAGIASVISAFGAAMLVFRIQRENDMRKEREIVWLPVADWLLMAATMICLLLVILPLVSLADLRLPAAASGTAAILVAGYIPAIMAHYRIVFRKKYFFWGPERKGLRENPEPTEQILAWATATTAIVFFVGRIVLASN